ncbi:MAG: sulfotransferase [Planctomycetaceae bacterium]
MAWQPDIIGIGAEKSATTWAWSMLNQHSEMCMSQPKELNFFNTNFDRGTEWYRSCFRYDAATQKCGEISPLYMDSPQAAQRIASACPQSRILVMLRNPFTRTISHLFHDAQNLLGGVTYVTPEAMKEFAAKDDKYLRRSQYGRQLQPFFDHFDVSQIGVFFFEDIAADSLGTVSALYRFAGIDSAFVPEGHCEKVNASSDFRFAGFTRVLMRASQMARSFPLTRQLMEWTYHHTKLRERIIDALSVDRGRPEIVFEDVFSSDTTDMIYRDLELLDRLLPNGCPESWEGLSPAIERSNAPVQTGIELTTARESHRSAA